MFEIMDIPDWPRNEGRSRTRVAWTVAVVGAWTLFGVLATAHFFFTREGDANTSFTGLTEHIVVFYWGWALLTPAVALLSRRIAATDRSTHRISLLLLGLIAITLAHGIIYLVATRLLGVNDQALTAISLRDYSLRHGGGDVATYLVLVGALLYRDALRKNQVHRVAAAGLEAQLARADLELLRWQLQPHFLFNALNALSTLVLKADVNGAERAITLIAQYLRSTLRLPADALVSLSHELQMAERYVAIEALRFGAGVRLECTVPADLLDHAVPSMILQPLVENAIRHGIGTPCNTHHDTETHRMFVVAISARRVDGRLFITVSDPALASERTGTGFGLRYVRERLEHHYGYNARCELRREQSATVAIIDLPFITTQRRPMRSAS